MLMHPLPSLNIFWGNAATCTVDDRDFKFFSFWQQRRIQLGVSSLWLLEQQHTSRGFRVHDDGKAHCFGRVGDYLITNQPGVAVTASTADCLPIIFYDKRHKAVAAIHSGWVGTVSGIAACALRDMGQQFGTQPHDLKIWFGAHARVCCYEVQPDFLKNLDETLSAQTVVMRGGKLFFDNALYSLLLLQAVGVAAEQVDQLCAECTMCVPGYHSRRKEGPGYIAQMSSVWLS